MTISLILCTNCETFRTNQISHQFVSLLNQKLLCYVKNITDGERYNDIVFENSMGNFEIINHFVAENREWRYFLQLLWKFFRTKDLKISILQKFQQISILRAHIFHKHLIIITKMPYFKRMYFYFSTMSYTKVTRIQVLIVT